MSTIKFENEELVNLSNILRKLPTITYIQLSQYINKTKNEFIKDKKYNPRKISQFMLKNENIGAINWGLVNGKTNTIFAWDTPIAEGEPIEWFHDVFRKDGTPYRQDEVDLIKKLNKN